MRISDWSSDVCSSDLFERFVLVVEALIGAEIHLREPPVPVEIGAFRFDETLDIRHESVGAELLFDALDEQDRKSVVEGKSVSVRVDLGGRRNIKKQKKTEQPRLSTLKKQSA